MAQGDIGSRFVRTYTTMSGCDVTAILDDKNVQTLAGISVSVTREKAPVYTLGSASPRSITRGKRGIAGSMVHTIFDRGALWNLREDPRKWYYAHLSEISFMRNPFNAAAPPSILLQNDASIGTFDPTSRNLSNQADAVLDINSNATEGTILTGTDPILEGSSAVNEADILRRSRQSVLEAGNQPGVAGPNVTGDNQVDSIPVTPGVSDREWAAFNQDGFVVLGGPNPIPANDPRLARGGVLNGAAISVKRMASYSDQTMPFDCILVAQNEYGQASHSGVLGVEIINEGTGLSIDDITNEVQQTYIALQREDWRPIEPAGAYGDPAQSAVVVRDGKFQVSLADDRGNPLQSTQEWIPSYFRDTVGNPFSVNTASTATPPPQ